MDSCSAPQRPRAQHTWEPAATPPPPPEHQGTARSEGAQALVPGTPLTVLPCPRQPLTPMDLSALTLALVTSGAGRFPAKDGGRSSPEQETAVAPGPPRLALTWQMAPLERATGDERLASSFLGASETFLCAQSPLPSGKGSSPRLLS